MNRISQTTPPENIFFNLFIHNYNTITNYCLIPLRKNKDIFHFVVKHATEYLMRIEPTNNVIIFI